MSETSRKEFDRLLGTLPHNPDSTSTRPTTIQTAGLLGAEATITCIVRTVRIRDERGDSGDWIFLQHLHGDDYTPIAIPPAVADCIARQRDSLGTMNRRKAGRTRAEADKAAGRVPGFMRGKRKGKA